MIKSLIHTLPVAVTHHSCSPSPLRVGSMYVRINKLACSTCFSVVFLLMKVFHRVLFCPVHIIPSQTCLGCQLLDELHLSIECINSTMYTVGTVGISDMFYSVPGPACCPPAPWGFVLVWLLFGSPRLGEGFGVFLVLPQRTSALCQPFPRAAGLCRATTQKFCML